MAALRQISLLDPKWIESDISTRHIPRFAPKSLETYRTLTFDFDLETLVATRGPNFPLGRLEARLMCPACGNRRVVVVFEPPSNAAMVRGE
jgi:hypothetical protein